MIIDKTVQELLQALCSTKQKSVNYRLKKKREKRGKNDFFFHEKGKKKT